MPSFKEHFEKQGGIRLVKEYWRAGVLLYAIMQIIITGKSKKSLELLRLGVKQKIQRKLKKKYLPELIEFDNKTNNTNSNTDGGKRHVWVFWMQGIENAPELVKRCYKSLKDNITDREITLITEKNISDYVEFPDFIKDKYKKGIITTTHLSDLLRMELLIKYGGTWVDATVLCTGKNIPEYMLNSDFFVFQNLRPGDNGNVVNLSSWFMTSCKNNKILLAVRKMIYKYWSCNDYMIDYFLFHHFIAIALQHYNEECSSIIKYPNSLPHVLLLMLFEPFDQQKWNELTNICPFHKLAYKRSKEEMEIEGTYYRHIME